MWYVYVVYVAPRILSPFPSRSQQTNLSSLGLRCELLALQPITRPKHYAHDYV